jgi:hypothetical protein
MHRSATVVGANLCARDSLAVQGKGIRGPADKEAYISWRQHFVTRCLSSYVGNVFGLLFLLSTSQWRGQNAQIRPDYTTGKTRIQLLCTTPLNIFLTSEILHEEALSQCHLGHKTLSGQCSTSKAHCMQPLEIRKILNCLMWAEVHDLVSLTQIIKDDGSHSQCEYWQVSRLTARDVTRQQNWVNIWFHRVYPQWAILELKLCSVH